MMKKHFRIETLGGEDVLGGPVSEDNAYVKCYPEIAKGEKRPSDLDVYQSTIAVYRLSGSKGTYRIVRVEDRETKER